MQTPKKSIGTKVFNFFRTADEDVRLDEDDAAPFRVEEEQSNASQKRNSDENWDRIRDMAIRGNAAGAIAALTIIGSGSARDIAPHRQLFWIVFIFLCGLLAVLARRFLDFQRIRYNSASEINILYTDMRLRPPPAFDYFVILMDVLAVCALLVGGAKGVYILYEMTR